MASPNTSRTLTTTLRITGSLVVAAALGSAGEAQSLGYGFEDESPDFYQISEPPPQWDIDFSVTTFGHGDLNKVGNTLSLNRTRLRFDYRWPTSENENYSIGIMEEDTNFYYAGGSALDLNNPFDSVTQFAFFANFDRWDEDGSAVLNTSLSSGRESGVSPSQGIYAEVLTGKSWKVSDNVELGIGLYAYNKLEDNIALWPFPIFKWQAADDLKIGFIESNQPVFGLEYDWTDSVDFYITGSFVVRQYRLLDRTEIPGNSAAAVDQAIGLKSGFVFDTGSFRAELFGGLTRRKLSVQANNSTYQDDVVDPAPSIGGRLTWSL